MCGGNDAKAFVGKFMGFESIYYGAIVGDRSYRENKKVISLLPTEDDFPFLTRGIFHINEEDQPFSAYVSHIIHFGGSHKIAEWEWELEWLKEWLPKFENLLRQMFWTEAYIHLHGENGGVYRCYYAAKYNNERYHHQPPLPVTTWKFIGDWDESDFYDLSSNATANGQEGGSET